MKETATNYVTMTNLHKLLSLMLLGTLVVLTGCDQSEQNIEANYGDRYIISLGNSAVGDADGVNIRSSTAAVTAPDTVSYFVQGYTTEKNYTWTLNGSELPVEVRAQESYEWERRGGEFVSVVFSQDDPLANVDPNSSTTNTLRVNSPDDNINAEEIEITTQVPTITGQLSRLGDYSTLASLATTAGVASVLEGNGPFTLLAPMNDVLDGLSAVPSQATDADEPVSSSVLADILKYHAIPSDVASGDITDGQTASTLFGDQTVSFSANGGVSVNGGQASVVRTDIPSTNGALHGIDGLLLPSTASVDFTDRDTESLVAGDTVTVDGSFIPEGGGFVVLHDSTQLADQGAIPSIVGKSAYIEGNSIANEVDVILDEAVSSTTTIGAMPHQDTNDNQTYDFETSAGTQDGPYTLNGSAILDYAVFNVTN